MALISGMQLKIKGIRQQDYQQMIESVGISEHRAQLAYRRAVDKTMTWLKKTASQDIKGELAIPMKVLRKRLLAYRTKRDLMRAKVWFGLRSFDATYIGKGRQLKRKGGVQVGPYFFPGSFKGAVYGKAEKIWIRKSSKHFDPNRSPYKVRDSGDSGFVEQSHGRFPVVKARINTEEAEDIFVEWVAKAESVLARLIYRELTAEIRRKVAHA